MAVFGSVFESSGLTPHGFCLAWEPGLISLHAVSDAVIAASYYSIPVALGALVRRRSDFAFPGLAWLFVTFIAACGTTHVLGALTLWYPVYWLDGGVKAFTAVISLVTAAALWPILPKALALPSPAQLQRLNNELQQQVAIRETTARQLAESRAALQEAQKREALARLAQAESLLKAVGEASTDLFYAKDTSGRLLYANPAILAVIGRSWAEVAGRTDAEFLQEPGQAERVIWNDQQIMASGVPQTVEEVVTDARLGEARIWQSNKSPLRDPETGEITGLIGVSRDVTQARRAEEALAENQARLQELVDTLDLATVIVRTPEGAIRYWATGCERLYGWSAAEAIGRDLHEMLQTVFPAPLAEIEAQLRQTGEWSGDLLQRTRSGRDLVVAAHKVLRRDPAGQPLAVMESLNDHTELNETEAKLRQMNEHLSMLVREEVAAREAALQRMAHSQRLEALGKLAGGIAHDFNNVLQAAIGGASLIDKDPGDAERVRRLSRAILGATERGISVTRRLLLFSRSGDLRAVPIEPAGLLAGLTEILAHTLGGNIEVKSDIAADLPALIADKTQLEVALVNLATNGRDAMAQGGTLLLSAALDPVREDDCPSRPVTLAAGDYIRLTVADTGCGMDAKTLARALEPFFTTKPVGQGTGLGLSMARGFAEQSGGGLHIESEERKGTRVTLWLPAATGPVEAGAPPERRIPQPARQAGLPRLMVVDDEMLIREIIAESLRSSGYQVVSAGSASEALALLEAGEQVALVITDLSMPGMDGVALIGELQRRRPNLPAILLTGFASRAGGLSRELRSNDRFSVMLKPVDPDQLADRISVMINVLDDDLSGHGEAAAPDGFSRTSTLSG